MSARELVSGVDWVGAIDWDRRLFDELIPLPDGTSYNAYLIRGTEKTALIDTVDPTKTEDLLANLRSLGITFIDYLVVNHAEQDHSGSIPRILQEYPGIRVVTNEKCRDLLKSLLLLPDDVFFTIHDGETLFLGDRTLEFLITPWVHWPETMLTYLKEEKILFSCDFFGSHLASSDLYVQEKSRIYAAAKRYYAEIMMPFRGSIKNHLERLKGYDLRRIAPSHGPIWDDPEFILSAYANWVSDRVKNEVVIVYVSMHGTTATMVSYLINALMKRGITVKPFNLTVTDLGDLATALVDTATIIVGTPTTLFHPHPAAVYATHLVRVLRPKARYVTIIGSYGWGGKTVKVITEMLDGSQLEILDPVVIQGFPREKEYESLDHLADTIVAKHREDALVERP
jgi:flavorubredoxin